MRSETDTKMLLTLCKHRDGTIPTEDLLEALDARYQRKAEEPGKEKPKPKPRPEPKVGMKVRSDLQEVIAEIVGKDTGREKWMVRPVAEGAWWIFELPSDWQPVEE